MLVETAGPRYLIHAGPHLMAKEFCYFQILIVKTAIHHFSVNNYYYYSNIIFFTRRGIGQSSQLIQVLLVLASCCVFGKQSQPSIMCHTQSKLWLSFSSNLRIQFAEFLHKHYLYALVYSTYEPVSVYGTVSFYYYVKLITRNNTIFSSSLFV